jgi:hypothetical protein
LQRACGKVVQSLSAGFAGSVKEAVSVSILKAHCFRSTAGALFSRACFGCGKWRIFMRVFSMTGIFMAALLLSGNSVALNFNVELDQAMLQQTLSSAFPVQKNESFVSLQLAEPQVILKEGSDRIGVKTVATVSLPGGNRFAGSTMVDGKLRYAAKNNALFLDQARVRELDITGLPDMVRQDVIRIATVLVRAYLDRQPLYVFKADPSSALLKKSISRVEVKNGKLVVEVSAF